VLEVALAAAATLLSLAMGLSIFERWLERRRAHEAAWAAAFALITVASAALALGAGLGWGSVNFRVFYLFGAIVNVPVLALGTVFLQESRRTARASLAGVALFAAFACGVMAVAPFTNPLPVDRLARGSEVLPLLPRLLAAVASGVASLVVVGGAIRSAIRDRKVRGSGRRVTGNGLIALGVLLTGASGLANSVLGEMGAFALFLALGIAVIFAGYLTVVTAPDRPATAAAARRPSAGG
jgi:hypothetical protein